MSRSSMIADLDIYRAAKALIEQHGEEAPVHAAMRADELAEAGDVEGHTVWTRIVRAVRELLDDRPPGDGRSIATAVKSWDSAGRWN